MASGIDWFRWHHGSVTDPKFGLVAKKAGVRLGDVIATWAFVLESASANSVRGVVGQIDFESLDFMLGLDDGVSAKILDAMTARGLLCAEGNVSAWEKRQPKREREGDNSYARVKAFREKKRNETPCNASETPCNDEKRLEKSIQEVNPPTPRKRGSDAPAGFDQFWLAYPRKVSKPQAEKAWRKLNPDAQTLQNILEGVARDGRSDQWLRDGGQFVPHPATWLNGRRWEDGPIEVSVNAASWRDDPLFAGMNR